MVRNDFLQLIRLSALAKLLSKKTSHNLHFNWFNWFNGRLVADVTRRALSPTFEHLKLVRIYLLRLRRMIVNAENAKRLAFSAHCETTMDQFSRRSGIAPLIFKPAPKINLGQIRQLSAACLGHGTYDIRCRGRGIRETRRANVRR